MVAPFIGRADPALRKVWLWRGVLAAPFLVPTAGWPLVEPLGVALQGFGLDLVTALLVSASFWYVIALVGVALWSREAIRRFSYELGDEALRIRRGALLASDTVVPLERIEDATIRRGPILRRYGLATVRLRFAGVPSHPMWGEAQLSGVREPDALVALLLDRAHRRRSVA